MRGEEGPKIGLADTRCTAEYALGTAEYANAIKRILCLFNFAEDDVENNLVRRQDGDEVLCLREI